mmetsp:Transcript_30967/g.64248  ORF Transcript_30967/g.64248 Transcript_30967/m.64248 type:complete len:142 (+) Transcript_30967:90-515(+)
MVESGSGGGGFATRLWITRRGSLRGWSIEEEDVLAVTQWGTGRESFQPNWGSDGCDLGTGMETLIVDLMGLVVGDMASNARLPGLDGLCSEEHGRVAKGEVVDWDKWWNLGVEEEDLLQDCGSRGWARFEAGALRRRTCWL